MNLAGWRFVLFALIGTAAIVLLASIGVPGRDGAPIDRHTGERGAAAVASVAEALQEARLTGSARLAIERVRERLEQFSGHRQLRQLEAVLLAELTPEPSDVHPAAAVIARERELASRAREEELPRRARAPESMTRAALLALLGELEADEQIAASTEAVFAPLARWPAADGLEHRPDELAARLRARLDGAVAPDPRDEERILTLLRSFRAADRPRARLRWALRGFGLFPQSNAFLDELCGIYLEQGRIAEAYLALGTALRDRPEDLELWRRRARAARWGGLPAGELEACRALLAGGETAELHERCIELCGLLGRPDEAVPHAEALARGSQEREVRLLPAVLALQAGDVDTALELLDRRARESDDPAWWREKIIEYATQDMREERVIAELRLLHGLDPDGGYERRLEGILRRRDRLPDLADLLAARLERSGPDEATERELMQILLVLGREGEIRALLATQAARVQDPLAFFRALPSYRAAGVPGLDAMVLTHAESDSIVAKDVPEALTLLEADGANEASRRAAAILARRHPALPETREHLLAGVDREADDAARAKAAGALSNEFPDDVDLADAWAQRAGWAGDADAQIAARERLSTLRGDDLDNRRALAQLYSARDRKEDALREWRVIAAREGVHSTAQLRLVDALLATGRLEEATAILEKRAQLDGASNEDRLHVADQLFAEGQFGRAAHFYEAVLERAPEHAAALLSLGRIRAWTNDPRGAIPFLERRLAVSTDEAAAVQFTLGECHWAIGEERSGRRLHQLALAALERREERTTTEDVMVATIMARLGRYEEARPIFDRIVAAQPDNVDLTLDYADAMLAAGDLEAARAMVDAARERQPRSLRAYRLDAILALREKRYEAAAGTLGETLDAFGPDAGTAAELGRARQLSGDFTGARDAYAQALALQPHNRDLEVEYAALEDWVAPALHLGLAARLTGDDSTTEAWLAGSTLWKNGRTRLGFSLAGATYSGRAAAVDAGATDVDSEVVRLDVAATRRFLDMHRAGAGVTFFPGANGNTPVSAWAGVHLIGTEPYRSLRARLWWNDLFDDPAAAVGLGGRTTGGAIDGDLELPARFWVGAGVRYERLSLDFDGNRPSDPRVVASATIGWHAIPGATRVGDAHRVHRPLMPGLVGARLPELRADEGRDAWSIWFNASTYRVLDGAELGDYIPLGARFDYLTLASRYDRHLARGLGAMVEGYFGHELQEGKNIFGVAAGLGWRPQHSFELAIVGAYGSALGRTGDDDSFALRVGLTWRW